MELKVTMYAVNSLTTWTRKKRFKDLKRKTEGERYKKKNENFNWLRKNNNWTITGVNDAGIGEQITNFRLKLNGNKLWSNNDKGVLSN